jgi:hypothetical protein
MTRECGADVFFIISGLFMHHECISHHNAGLDFEVSDWSSSLALQNNTTKQIKT